MSSGVLCAIDVSNPEQDTHVLKEAIRQAKSLDTYLDVMTVVPDYGVSRVSTLFDMDQHKAVVAQSKEAVDAIVAPLTDEKTAPKRAQSSR